MLTHLRSNAVAYLALFIALSGTSYASVQLPKDSVRAKQIAAGAVGSSEVKNNTLTGRDIKDGSLEAKDLAIGLPAGPRGAPGLPGLDGSARAYAVVQQGSSATCSLRGLSRGAVTVRRLDVGKFCVRVDGASNTSDLAIATVAAGTAQPIELANVAVYPVGCEDTQTREEFLVVTTRTQETFVTDTDGELARVRSDDELSDLIAFAFILI